MHVTTGTLVSGLVLGLNYGLLAVGLVLVYRASRVLNFAHGQLGVVSAVLVAKLVQDFGVNYWPALLFALGLAVVVGAGSELLLRRLFDRPRLVVMVATIGLSQLLFLITLLPFVRPKKIYAPYPVPFHLNLVLGGTSGYHVAASQVMAIVAAPTVVIALAVFWRKSAHGLAMRALAENDEAARLSGVWTRRTTTMVWALAGLLSAVTAVLAAPGRGIGLTEAVGPTLLMRALTAALIAAMVSLPVAFVAGVAIGLVEQIAYFNFNVNSTAATATLMFVLLLVVLIVRVNAIVSTARTGRSTERSSWAASGEPLHPPGDLARRQLGLLGAGLAVVAVAALPLVLTNGGAFLVSRIFVFGLIAVSMTVLTGWAGQLSLGQFGLVAVGVVVTARLAAHVPLLALLPLAGAITALVAVVIGLPALRIRGLYLAVTTLGFALFMQDAVLATPCWHLPLIGTRVCTGLPDPGSTLLQRPSLLGLSLDAKGTMYEFVLGVLVVVLVVARWWRDRGVSRVLVATRDNEVAAAAMGVRVVRAKLAAFALSGFVAGCAGVCFALVSERFSATTFDASQSILVVSMVVIGGLGSLSGAVLGAVYLIGLPAVFGSTQTVQFLTSGVGLTAFILYLPGGLAQVLRQVGDAIHDVIVGREVDDVGESAPDVTIAAAHVGPASPARLQIDSVEVAFGGVKALDGLDLVIEPAQIVAVIGPNGSGKTTLLDVISGQVDADRGWVRVDGIDLVDHLPEDRARLGIVRSFQDGRLFPGLSVRDTLLVAEDARHPAGVLAVSLQPPWERRREATKRQAALRLTRSLGLGGFVDHDIGELSTGTRRVVDLAAILGAHPRLLLLDEPTSGIAQREAEAFGPLLRRLHAATGATIVLVEHDVMLALSLADIVVVMETGRVVAVGPPESIVEDPAAIAAYLGASHEALARSGPIGPRAIQPETTGRS